MTVGVVLGDLRRVMKWSSGGFCAEMRVQAMLYFAVDGGGGETKSMRNAGAVLAAVIELLNEQAVIPVYTAVFLNGCSPLKV